MRDELPDTCPFSDEYDELDEMIRDLAHEKELPHGIHPDCVGGDPDYHHYWGNGQQERHQQSVAWRVKLFWELKARPEWVAAWRAARDLDCRIKALCERKGYASSLGKPHRGGRLTSCRRGTPSGRTCTWKAFRRQ